MKGTITIEINGVAVTRAISEQETAAWLAYADSHEWLIRHSYLGTLEMFLTYYRLWIDISRIERPLGVTHS